MKQIGAKCTFSITKAATYFIFMLLVAIRNVRATTIQEIQGDGMSSPLKGESVDIYAVYVTAVAAKGFFIQETSTSNNSSGIFVHSTGDLPSKNDIVDVTGKVSEFRGETQISSSSYKIIASNQILPFTPVPLTLPLSKVDDFERYEGMLVSVVPTSGNALVVSGYKNFDRFGEVLVCSVDNEKKRPYIFTQVQRPSTDGYQSYQEAFGGACVTIDDNQNTQNPDPVLFGGIYECNSKNCVRGGSTISVLEGPLSYASGKYVINPLKLDYENGEESETTPPLLPDSEIKLAQVNLLNYFVTYPEDGGRGADDEDEFVRQWTKTVNALKLIDADFFGFTEIENVEGNLAAKDLKMKLNEVSTRTYEAVSVASDMDKIGDNSIKIDMFYDSEKFDLISAHTLDDGSVSDSLLSESTKSAIFNGYNRVPLVAVFKSKENGKMIAVGVNHLKSKRSSNSEGIDADQGDGASAWNQMRLLAAKAILEWYDEVLPDGIGNLVFMGDFNSYAYEDPIQHFVTNGYASVIDYDGDVPPYSYAFSGQFGTLDHAFVPEEMKPNVAGAVWHVNADYPDLLDYNTDYGRNEAIFDGTTPIRFSDHDVIVVAMNLTGTEDLTCDVM